MNIILSIVASCNIFFSQYIEITLLDAETHYPISSLFCSLNKKQFFTNSPLILKKRTIKQPLFISHVSYQDTTILIGTSSKTIYLKQKKYQLSLSEVISSRELSWYKELFFSPLDKNQRQINYFLNKNIGVQSSNYGNDGALRELKYRGLPSQHSQILIDYIPIDSFQNNSYNLSNLSVLNLQKVSIYSDSDDPGFSSQSIGATINFSSKEVFQNLVESQFSTGSYRRKKRSIAFRFFKKKISLYAGIADFYSDNYFPYQKNNLETAYRNGADVIQEEAVFQILYVPSPEQKVHFSYRKNKNDSGVPGPKRNLNIPFQKGRTRQVDKATLLSARYENATIKNFYFRFLLSYNPQKLTYAQNTKNDYTQSYSQLNLQYRFFSPLFLEATIDYKQGHLQMYNERAFYKRKRKQYGITLQSKYAFNAKHSLRLTTRKEYTENFNQPFIFFISYQNQISSNFSSTVHLSSVYRVPTLNELYFPNSGNPSIKPEKGLKFSLSLAYKSKFIQWRNTYYHTSIANYILWTSKAGRVQPININTYLHQGIENSLRFSLPFINIQVSYLYNILEDQEKKQQIYNAPKHTIRFLASVPYKKFLFSVTSQWNGIYRLFGVSKEHPPTHNIDIQAQQSFVFGAFKTALYLNIHNLLNNKSPPFVPYPEPNVNYDIGLKLSFNYN